MARKVDDVRRGHFANPRTDHITHVKQQQRSVSPTRKNYVINLITAIWSRVRVMRSRTYTQVKRWLYFGCKCHVLQAEHQDAIGDFNSQIPPVDLRTLYIITTPRLSPKKNPPSKKTQKRVAMGILRFVNANNSRHHTVVRNVTCKSCMRYGRWMVLLSLQHDVCLRNSQTLRLCFDESDSIGQYVSRVSLGHAVGRQSLSHVSNHAASIGFWRNLRERPPSLDAQ